MRKVITGEQVAQLYNRDPFALPAWRAPIYETPGWIIALVQLVRLLRWLVRLVVRHPVAATVVAVLVLAWLNVGWPGLVLLLAWALVVLAAWWFFWPGSFARRVAGPAGGKWRCWCYRRRWARVMAISGAAPSASVPIRDRPDLKALPVGRREDGLPWLVRLHGTHVLIAGATGAGKASLLWGGGGR